MSRRVRRSKTRASMGDCADRGAGLSKVGLRARSAPVAAPATVTATVTARKIANRDKRIWIAEIVYRSNPEVGEKFWLCEWEVSGNGTRSFGTAWCGRSVLRHAGSWVRGNADVSRGLRGYGFEKSYSPSYMISDGRKQFIRKLLILDRNIM